MTASNGYTPTIGDLVYRNATENGDVDPFEEAHLLMAVSHEYLAVLASDNATPASAGFKAMIDAESARRGFAAARRANRIALGSLAISAIALLISIFS